MQEEDAVSACRREAAGREKARGPSRAACWPTAPAVDAADDTAGHLRGPLPPAVVVAAGCHSHLDRLAELPTYSLFRPQTVKETLAEIIPERQALAKQIKAEHGSKQIGTVTVEQLFGGMRGVKCMLWEPSVLDSEEGIRFWGRSCVASFFLSLSRGLMFSPLFPPLLVHPLCPFPPSLPHPVL